MVPLIETIIGFTVIMLLLSFLVKSLTSLVKNLFDYYSKNFVHELSRLLEEIFSKKWKELENDNPLLKKINWKRLGEDFLSEENIKWLLTKLQLPANKMTLVEQDLKTRLEVHKANIRFQFERQNKNISLVLGIVLCLAFNINGFTIWDTLYNDQEVRAKFSSPEYVESVEKAISETQEEIDAIDDTVYNARQDSVRQALKDQQVKWAKQLAHFKGEVSFGVGKIWTREIKTIFEFLFEFFGSLLTGIFVSIGAPFWHDILRLFSNWRQSVKP